MRLPRLTTRRLMALVMLLAFSMGAMVQMRRLRLSYQAQAARHSALERSSRRIASYAAGLRNVGLEPRGDGGAALGRRAAYHAAMRQKYERAARYPWLSIAPDPPPPE